MNLEIRKFHNKLVAEFKAKADQVLCDLIENLRTVSEEPSVAVYHRGLMINIFENSDVGILVPWKKIIEHTCDDWNNDDDDNLQAAEALERAARKIRSKITPEFRKMSLKKFRSLPQK